jgi:hypothetical protein
MIDEIVATSSIPVQIEQTAMKTTDDGDEVDGILNRVGIGCRTLLDGIDTVCDGNSFRHGFLVVGWAIATSIFTRQQHTSRTSIRLGNDPKLHALLCAINRQQSVTMSQGIFIGLPILVADIAPIASDVPSDELHRTLLGIGQCLDGTRRRNQFADAELEFGDLDHF